MIVAVGVISVPLKVNVMVYALPALNELSSVPAIGTIVDVYPVADTVTLIDDKFGSNIIPAVGVEAVVEAVPVDIASELKVGVPQLLRVPFAKAKSHVVFMFSNFTETFVMSVFVVAPSLIMTNLNCVSK